jgi:putative acetyltransferase
LPNAQAIIVARFHNRQDADDHKRLLHRFIPNAEFEIIFDAPNEQQEENQTYALS